MTQTPAAPPSTVGLEVLTDEELAVLSGPGGIVVTPFLERMDPREREAVTRTAYRSLVARGIVDPPSAETRARVASESSGPDGVEIELMVRQDVLGIVTLRRAARAVVAMARTTATTQDFWYAHVVDDVCLLEEVGSDGLHRFALCDTVVLPATVVGAAVHPEAGDAHGDPMRFRPLAPDDPTPPAEIVERVGEALLRCDLTVRTEGDESPPLLGLFTGPAGSWLSRSERGSGQDVRVEPCSAGRLRAEVRRTVLETVAVVVPDIVAVPTDGG